MTVRPERSITFAPAGTAVPAAGPTAWIFPPEITTVWSSPAGPPVPSITRTCVSAMTGASTLTKALTSGDGVCAKRGAARQRNAVRKRPAILISDLLVGRHHLAARNPAATLPQP